MPWARGVGGIAPPCNIAYVGSTPLLPPLVRTCKTIVYSGSIGRFVTNLIIIYIIARFIIFVLIFIIVVFVIIVLIVVIGYYFDFSAARQVALLREPIVSPLLSSRMGDFFDRLVAAAG